MLTDTAIRAARPKDRPYRLLDREGLYLRVTPKGRRSWRLRIYRDGKESTMVLGRYPEVSLQRARELAFEARREVQNGKDPVAQRRAAKIDRARTWEAAARDWLASRKDYKPPTVVKNEWLIGLMVPHIGSRPIGELTPDEVLIALRGIEARGHYESTQRCKHLVGRVLRWSRVRDVTGELERGTLLRVKAKHHPGLTDPARVGELLRRIDAMKDGRFQPSTYYLLRLTPYLFQRPSELRCARWDEFDLAGAQWRIPEHRMKMEELHVVPLAAQVVTLLKELQAITGRGELVFPGLRNNRPLSNNTVNATLRTLGYTKDEQTHHGFRTTASTLLNELGVNKDLVELQLSHAERDEIRGAYNRAVRLQDREDVMRVWAGYLDALKAGDPGTARAAARAAIQSATSLSSQPTAPSVI